MLDKKWAQEINNKNGKTRKLLQNNDTREDFIELTYKLSLKGNNCQLKRKEKIICKSSIAKTDREKNHQRAWVEPWVSW